MRMFGQRMLSIRGMVVLTVLRQEVRLLGPAVVDTLLVKQSSCLKS